MRMRRWTSVAAVLISAVGCGTEDGGIPRRACAPPADKGPPWDFQVYSAGVFTLCLPADAAIGHAAWPPVPPEFDTRAPTDSIVVIRGPELDLDPSSNGAVYWRGPTYELKVWTFDNPTGESLEQFVLAHAEEEAKKVGMTAEQLAVQNPRFHLPVLDTIAGQLAVWLSNMPLCPDCTFYRAYFGRGNHVVAIGFLGDDAYMQDPIRSRQRILYAYVLESFRWRSV